MIQREIKGGGVKGCRIRRQNNVTKQNECPNVFKQKGSIESRGGRYANTLSLQEKFNHIFLLHNINHMLKGRVGV